MDSDKGSVIQPVAAMEPEQKKKGRLFSIQNVGGSITVIFQLAVLAFGVRHLRNILAKRRKCAPAGNNNGSPGFAQLSLSALSALINLDPTPFKLIDIRTRDEAQENPLPFEDVLCVPGSVLFLEFVSLKLGSLSERTSFFRE